MRKKAANLSISIATVCVLFDLGISRQNVTILLYSINY